MHVRSLGFRTDLALLRLGGSEVTDRGDHLVVRSPHNPDFWWGNFLLLKRAPDPGDEQSWLDRFAAEFPAAGHVTLGIDDPDGRTDQLRGFAERGFTVEAATVLTASTVNPPRSADARAECRPLRSDDDWAASVELRMRCDAGEYDYEPDVHRRFVTAKARTNRELCAAGHAVWFGAFHTDRLVSQLGLVRAADRLARFQTVETDPDFRRQGLAGTLLHQAARYGLDGLDGQHGLGVEQLVIVADPDYHAIELYRAVGFAPAQTQLQTERRPPPTDR